jgi:cation:H+ antiporter
MSIVFQIILLIVGFSLLIKGADFLVDGASSLAKKMAVSEIVIGLTIVAFGTSTPELIVNIFSAVSGKSDISFGNIIGSNIANLLLILGISGIIRPLHTQKNTVWKEIPFALLAAIVLFLLCNDSFFDVSLDILSRGDGIILLLFFIIFLVYNFAIAEVQSVDSPDIKMYSCTKISVLIILGLAGLIVGGKLVVDSAVQLAVWFGMSEKLIGLTIVAIGTSLPELFTSAVAASKGKSDIAVGNIIGSNIFNIFFILSITAIIQPLPYISVLNTDMLVLIVASVLLFITMFTGKKRSLDRWEAIIFVLLYFAYTVFLIIRN